MSVKSFHITSFLSKALLLLMMLLLLPVAWGQTDKPNELREEILKAKEDEERRVAARKKKFTSTPKRGETVLKPVDPAKRNKDATLIKMEQAWEMSYDEQRMPGIQFLRGDVRFRQDNSLLFCDSAYFDTKANAFNAFNNVRIVQGDSLTIYGDYLYYDGNTKMAQVWDNVKLVNNNTTLTTNMLYYDRKINLAYYNTGGKVEDGKNILTSVIGEYSPDTKIALFKDKVKMTTPDSHMTTDTLKYNTDSSIADIVGNALIVHNDETDIYSQRGWYDTENDRMMLLDRSLVEHNDGKTLVGDTIFYDKIKKYGEAFSNVELDSPEDKTTLTGDFVSYDEITGTGYATKKALLIDWSQPDSLFLSADNLYTFKDSIETDTTSYQAFRAFKNARFLRKDVQGMADSLYYSSRDSIMKMRLLPVVWSDNNQLKANEIDAFLINDEIRKVVLRNSAIAIQKDSLSQFNQISGKEMIAFIDDGEVRKVDVSGNVETIYFPIDEKSNEYIGVNKTLSSFATAYFAEEKIERIVLTAASSGTMYPLFLMEEDDLFLRDFHWYEEERPRVTEDVFAKFERIEPPKRPESKKRPSFPGSGGGGGDSGGSKGGGKGQRAGESNTTNQTGMGVGNQGLGDRRSDTPVRSGSAKPTRLKLQ